MDALRLVCTAGFGSLSQLVKLQASFNPLTSLPADFYQLPALELARFAVSDFAAWPQDLLQTGEGWWVHWKGTPQRGGTTGVPPHAFACSPHHPSHCCFLAGVRFPGHHALHNGTMAVSPGCLAFTST
jgi:hypothetical protein